MFNRGRTIAQASRLCSVATDVFYPLRGSDGRHEAKPAQRQVNFYAKTVHYTDWQISAESKDPFRQKVNQCFHNHFTCVIFRDVTCE